MVEGKQRFKKKTSPIKVGPGISGSFNKEKDKKLLHCISPMLAKETDKAFDDKGWVFEIKWDGYRAIAEVKGQTIRLYSRNGIDFQEKYPVVADQLKKMDHDAVVDGEIVVLNREGKPDFQLLQHYSENRDRPIRYYIFDLLSLDGHDTTGLSLLDRKELLRKIIPVNEVIKYADHIVGRGRSFFAASGEKGLEGIMAKKAGSKYFPGKRTGDWLKIKNHRTAEVVIAGFTAPSGSRKYFGALVLAWGKGQQWVYAGHTGSGFDDPALKEIYTLLRPLIRKRSPFDTKVKTNSPVTWVKPLLICEIRYTEMTADKKFRHPVFLRLRQDKTLKEFDMATPKRAKRDSPDTPKGAASKNSGTMRRVSAQDEKENGKEKIYTFGKNKVKVTHVDKIYFPQEGITKGEVVEYYISMADYILPYLKGRPESLLRNPNGIKGQSFFQKDAAENAPSFVNSRKIHSGSSNKEIDYIICDNLATLVYLNNLGCIELNPWHSVIQSPGKPDYMMIDIDPSEKNSFDQVIVAALTVKKILDKAGALSFCKTSGATGMHIFVPTGRKYTYEQVKDFAYLICLMAHKELADFTTLERNLSKRSNQHIYMDYLQNRSGQTIASVYSLRPRSGATVSTPLHWKEVKKGLSPGKFTLYNTLQRVQRTGDLFKGVLGKGIDLKRCLSNLEG